MANGQKLFDAALRRAVAQNNGELVRQAAESLLINAASGVQWAVQMLADRLDGKAVQSVEVTQKKSVEECSLDELRDRIAAMLAGAKPQDRGADESRPVH
jgi:hypothetical protein